MIAGARSCRRRSRATAASTPRRNRDGRLAAAAASGLYRAILADIEAHDYDVFTRRAHVSTPRKLLRLPGIWQRSH